MKYIKSSAMLLVTGLWIQSNHILAANTDLEAQIKNMEKGETAGNFFIWFLCAIAFLKISQKMDSIISSLGLNVGRTGGSLLGEIMVAAKTLSSAKNTLGDSFSKSSSGSTSSQNHNRTGSPLSGAIRSPFNSLGNQRNGSPGNTGPTQGTTMNQNRGGELTQAQSMETMTKELAYISEVAGGSIKEQGTLQGEMAARALPSYLGQSSNETNDSNSQRQYSEVEIGGGRIRGVETSEEHPDGIPFGMYQADQYLPPEGAYETVQTADQGTWYKQYAADVVERNPYMDQEGNIKYNEKLVQKLPRIPPRKDRV